MDPFSVAALTALGKTILVYAGAAGASSAVATTVGAVAVGAAIVAVVGVLVHVTCLTIDYLKDFFRGKKHYKTSNNQAISFKTQLESGKRVIIAGIFDNDYKPVGTDAVMIVKYDSMSSELEELHSDDKIVEYR